ncbi:uncharacterized protein N7458_006877 [Penicillium daleae]|uniref:Uncharacterized protein n=1 Tax=Penicillium daleae TaxID=63821 RepID=A0AAD6C7X1_9EURO|nr:uncharacterized protein N7458_006877 [Penicillium daleae]KAJ5450428.1 hypothetical protein N7458_006877 [Penicillium daleae]
MQVGEAVMQRREGNKFEGCSGRSGKGNIDPGRVARTDLAMVDWTTLHGSERLGGGWSILGAALNLDAGTSPNIMADFCLLIGTQLVEPGANPITDLLVVKVLVDRCVFQGLSKGLSKDSQFVFGEFEQAAEGLAFAGAEVQADKSH